MGRLFGAPGRRLNRLRSAPLAYFGGSTALVWGVTSAVLGALILGSVGFLAYAGAAGTVPPRTPRVFWSFLGSGAALALLLLLSAADLVLPRGPAMVILALIWALVAAFAQLATFLLVTWSGRTP